MKTIQTKNLSLRPLQINDVTARYVKALSDPEVVSLTYAGLKKWSIKSVKKYIINSNKKGVSTLIGIFSRDSKKHIGNIRLFNFEKYHSRVELSIMIFDKSEWGKGYGFEALDAATKHVFNTLGLHRICADYYSVNRRSSRIFERVGFKIEGIFKDHFKLNGKFVDSIRIAKINKK